MEAPRFTPALLHPRFWPTWLAMGLWWLLAQLPFGLLLALGRGLGALFYRLGGERRRIVERNIELCFPELSLEQRNALVKRNFASYGIALFEVPFAWWAPAARFDRLVRVEGLEHIASLAGQGALLMAIHYTTLEVGAQAVGRFHPIDGMYRPHGNPVYDYVQRRGRLARSKASEVYTRKDVRGVARALRNGRVIWYAPDQDYGPRQSLFAPFFGIPAASVTATARFAQMGQARVLPFTHVRLPGSAGYRVTIHPPLDGFPSGDDLADATRINALVEAFIRQQPDQYLWAHRRFKTRPEGESPLYPWQKPRRRRAVDAEDE
ncbi:MAG: LpxL/LpxP family Kdo(2)-lipid IV(A) lauroyl/palmitoleoyl acyltransferase [Porticoccaceae bacterium]|jgi:KDO2-lipid IV(A) lauroyltransferase|nr:LpxL/LpxP family Kdo(2)-lipid IV(A) lauroyl/palmitoleoyl acyltransferase [Porticoccaceae bacterium]MEA3301095.1 LpxL/LpxP family Kdo(2)-lipid IV(A) lauroyl/palmitoleoyl acyltransferase [Pseudomonadota bacterium]HLS98157.1 LpxL/LpxP family Kdo(2)-lipid IV(A) lauroyl/palmitoleoyl acyltransferase [Porticoccaceae bacterium]